MVNGHMIWCTPKTHQARDVPIPGSLIDALVAGRRAKSPVRPAAATAGSHTRCRQFCEPDGLGVRAAEEDILWLSPHDLRHPAASLAIASGASVKHVQRMLGHKDAAMTLNVYASLFEDDLDDLLEAAAACVRPEPSANIIELPERTARRSSA